MIHNSFVLAAETVRDPMRMCDQDTLVLLTPAGAPDNGEEVAAWLVAQRCRLAWSSTALSGNEVVGRYQGYQRTTPSGGPAAYSEDRALIERLQRILVRGPTGVTMGATDVQIDGGAGVRVGAQLRLSYSMVTGSPAQHLRDVAYALTVMGAPALPTVRGIVVLGQGIDVLGIQVENLEDVLQEYNGRTQRRESQVLVVSLREDTAAIETSRLVRMHDSDSSIMGHAVHAAVSQGDTWPRGGADTASVDLLTGLGAAFRDIGQGATTAASAADGLRAAWAHLSDSPGGLAPAHYRTTDDTPVVEATTKAQPAQPQATGNRKVRLRRE